MPIRTFHINGTVTSLSTKKPVSGLRLEAWSAEAAQRTVFGSALSGSQGGFTIPADVNIPGGVVGPIPAVLRAFMGDQAVSLTGDTKIENLIVLDKSVRLVADVTALEPEKTDKVDFDQVVSVIDFFRLSDFKGVYREGQDRVQSAASLGRDGLKKSFSGFRLEPIKPPETRSKDILSQDPASASRRLAEREIKVTAVKPYDTSSGDLQTITALGSNLKRGDQVELYEQDGVVKGYKIIKPATTSVGTGDVNRLDQEIVRLKADLQERDKQLSDLRNELQVSKQRAVEGEAETKRMADEMKRIQSEKNEQVTTLTKELNSVKTEQLKISNERLKAIEDKLKRIP